MKRTNQEHSIRENGTLKIVTVNSKESRTQQQFKDQTNVNNILKKYSYNRLPNPQGQYIDTSIMPKDYQTALHLVMDAEKSFNSLPSLTRDKFKNNPQELFKFLQDPKNKEEAISLGLIPSPSPQQTHDENDEPKTTKTSKKSAAAPSE